MKYTRKDFLKTAGLSLTAAAALPVLGRNVTTEGKPGDFHEKSNRINFGMASYTLRKFNLDDALAMTKRVGLKNIALKSMHLPLNSPAEEIKAAAQKIKDAGINLNGVGVIYMKTEAEVNNAFEYAKALGAPMIIGVPNHELIPLVEKKVKEYNIKMAIHNHGPEDTVYPTPQSAYDKIKSLDKRIGLCIDIGHVIRMPLDPALEVVKYADRLMDMHIRDQHAPIKEAKTLEIGRGIIDYPKLLKALVKIKYQGVAALEIDKDENDPMPAIAESIGYVRGMLAMV